MQASLGNGRVGSKLADCLIRRNSVLAWGRNTSGQAYDFDINVHENPVTVCELDGANISSVSAALHHSAAVADGVVWTWGHGSQGELGRGASSQYCKPQRIESLIGQADIKQVALGNQHSLFLDSNGIVYSCGDNKQGQCGSGAPLEDIARQQRQEWEGWTSPSAQDSWGVRSERQGLQGYKAESMGNPKSDLIAPQLQRRMNMARKSHNPGSNLDSRLKDVSKLARLWEESESNPRGEKDKSMQSLHNIANTLRNWKNYPARLGAELNEVLENPTIPLEIGDVKQIAASKFFSALTLLNGEIFTCGGGYCGELGGKRSWDTRAQSVEGEVKEALEREGGAREVAAGGTFCVAVTNSGSVLSWGSLPGLPETRKRGNARVNKIEGMPPITHIAAGWSHAIFSNGQKVWAMGRWLTPDGTIMHGGQWGAPEVFLDLKQGVKSIAAGSHCSAAISQDGELYMWGKLLSRLELGDLLSRHYLVQKSTWMEKPIWEGLGSSQAVKVPGLGKVKSIALGSQHALAVLEN